MIVQLFDVRVPDATTRFLQVPEYDIPCIKALWRGKLKPDGQGNKSEITVTPLALFEFRSLHNERNRMVRDYSTQPDNAERSAYKSIYSSDEAFEEAHHAACEKGRAGKAAAEKMLAKATAEAATAAELKADNEERAKIEYRVRLEAEIRAKVEAEIREKIENETRPGHGPGKRN